MTVFTHAIVRVPCKNMVCGLTSSNLGKPNYELALDQHAQYIDALESCDVSITTLPQDERFPDSTFVEDTALLTPHCAIITNPGAPSRRDEPLFNRETIASFYQDVEHIEGPGTLDAGDIMMVGNHYYIGLSERTNAVGAAQMIEILERYGMRGSTVTMNDVLHLKTGVNYLENDTLLLHGEFANEPQFAGYKQLLVDDDEAYAANAVWVNGKVIVAAGFPKTQTLIERAGYATITVDVSEYQKIDGGLSCLSLRF
ncbi:MAG: arginine deiminase family protein [Pseudomonadota bacterium]